MEPHPITGWIDHLCTRSLVLYDNMGRVVLFIALTMSLLLTALAI